MSRMPKAEDCVGFIGRLAHMGPPPDTRPSDVRKWWVAIGAYAALVRQCIEKDGDQEDYEREVKRALDLIHKIATSPKPAEKQ